MRLYWIAAAALFVGPCFAGDFTPWAVPTRVDVVRGEGFMVFGSFGNPNSCSIGDRFFVPLVVDPTTHVASAAATELYNQMYAMALMAVAAGKPLQAYVDQCATQGWYTGPTVTFNQLDPCCSLNVGS